MEERAKQADELLQIDLANGQARVLLCSTTETVQTCADIHGTSAVCTAALGRLLTGAAMMGIMLKGDEESVTVTMKGDGPMGTLMAVADHGDVRGYADDPTVNLPPRADGKLDVGGAVGHSGRMTVIRDLGNGKQYIGQSEIVSGEIAMDFANYFTVSEQQPSLVALGVRVHEGLVLQAGGILIQPLPGCPEEIIDQLELRSPMFADISRELTFDTLEHLAEDWFRGLNPRILERTPVQYRCTCSRERMEKALISLGRKDLQSLIDEGEGAELSCHFCHRKHFFTTEQLREMLEKAEDRTNE
ncbi:MAG: Hsp33 family molecular chaperone HslO [Clostridia bacterium]|nr:Hsp33 family molecular chaperone HslO [Clostridia bacterium]MBR2663402.1 Hsp33 family molecular chaperone HslO [Clostridia bacterium]